jgi:hypothetical protein
MREGWIEQVKYLASPNYDPFKHPDGSKRSQADLLEWLDMLEASTLFQPQKQDTCSEVQHSELL